MELVDYVLHESMHSLIQLLHFRCCLAARKLNFCLGFWGKKSVDQSQA